MARRLLHILVVIILFFFSCFYKISLMDWQVAVSHSIVSIGMLMMVFYGHGKFLVNTFFEDKKYVHFAIGSIILFIVVFFFRKNIEIPLFPSYYNLPVFRTPNGPSNLMGVVTFVVMVSSTLVHLLENRFDKEQKALEIIQEHQAAQLQFLKAQINPHFLFNTLNNIYSLSIIQSEKTPAMVLKLADLLRYVIYESQNEMVRLDGEITQIRKYIELFQMKSEGDLNIIFEVEGDINNQFIEPMIFIPLVENSFKHCDFDINNNAFTKIKLKVTSKQIEFSTINSKSDADQQKDKVGGVGLKNIRKRLSLNYEDQHELTIKENQDTFSVFLKMNLTHE